MTDAYAPRTIKRTRRTRAAIQDIDDALYRIVEQQVPSTCRQVFYQAVSHGLIEKTEQAYKGVVCRRLAIMRREGRLPWNWIADNTRWMRKSESYRGLSSAINRTLQMYRRARWDNQDVHVEVWCEKDALAGVIFDITDSFDVPLMIARGFSSITYLYESARHIASRGKPAHVYMLGDHDPAGVSITESIQKSLREFCPEVEITFHRPAVTVEQIERYRLPTRPTKGGDSRSKKFAGESVDLDALPSAVLREIVETCITQHIDPDEWKKILLIEEEERSALDFMVQMEAERHRGRT